MSKIRIAIADDSKEFRKAIKRLIHLEDDLEVILEAENGQHLLEQLGTTTPDIILMDIRMPILNGIQSAMQIRNSYPHLKIIAFSQYDHEENIIEMNIQGVKSFIGKNDEPEELFKAIRVVHNGGIYMTDCSAQIVQRYLSYLKPQSDFSVQLNESERYLLKAICEGCSSTEIGKVLNKSPRTIEEYREKLYKKFNVKCKEELLRKTILFNRNNSMQELLK